MKIKCLSSITAFIVMLGIAQLANATGAMIVTDGTITDITNTSANTTTFAVTTSGGTGACINTQILFPLANSADAATFQRMYATALTAFSMNVRVKIYNYASSSCTTASYIEIYH